MTRDTFENFISDLCQAYDTRRRPTGTILNEYYETVYQVPEERTQEFLKRLLHTFNFFPKLKEIGEMADALYPVKHENKFEQQTQDYICPYCLNVGLIRASYSGVYPNAEYIYDTALPCPKCETGKQFHGDTTPFFDVYFGADVLEQVKKNNERQYTDMVQWKKNNAAAENAKKDARLRFKVYLDKMI